LLLEIEYWARRDPRNHNASLELANTAFFKLMPEPAIAVSSGPRQNYAELDRESRLDFRTTKTREQSDRL
jgi:hypothetical protein